jgi:hypothetical protein
MSSNKRFQRPKRVKVLIAADSDSGASQAVKGLLRKYVTFIKTTNARAAINAIAKHSPHVVIAHLRMPLEKPGTYDEERPICYYGAIIDVAKRKGVRAVATMCRDNIDERLIQELLNETHFYEGGSTHFIPLVPVGSTMDWSTFWPRFDALGLV